MRRNFGSKYVKWGLTGFVSMSATILFFFMLFRLDIISGVFSKIFDILMPFVYGLVVAYLLCPLYNFWTRNIYQRIHHRVNQSKALSISRLLSTTITICIAFLAVGGLISLVLPQLVDSLINLARTAPSSVNHLLDWGEKQIFSNPALNEAMSTLLGDYTTKFNTWVETVVLPTLLALATHLSTGIIDLFGFIWDFIIGIIICIYFLNSKEMFKAQTKKIICALFDVETAIQIIKEAKFVNKTFGGFITGKLIDSAIIGCICFIVLSIFKFPYIMLVSVIVGFTNIIPFFGPFIGAIPSTVIILTASPIHALYFVIFIIILQQVDGNIIGPKILGGSTGIPSFWVMFAILFGGGLFGFVGMVLGIPVFAVLYAYISRAVDNKLQKKNMPVNTNLYKDLSNYGETGRDWLSED